MPLVPLIKRNSEFEAGRIGVGEGDIEIDGEDDDIDGEDDDIVGVVVTIG